MFYNDHFSNNFYETICQPIKKNLKIFINCKLVLIDFWELYKQIENTVFIVSSKSRLIEVAIK